MKPRTLLIVDDDDELRDVLVEVLRSRGYVVRAARDGVEATKAIAKSDVELVVTDLIMPEKDGIQLMNEIRRKYPKVKIVAMSGGGHVPREQYLRIARGLGAHAVLEKPFSSQQLVDLVEQLLPRPVA